MTNPDLRRCPTSEGKQCLSLDKCNNEAILTNSIEPNFLNVDSDGHVHLDATQNLCSVDNKVCCTPKDNDPCNNDVRKPQYMPKCGQHNALGKGLRISNPSAGKSSTQFGEWPHACILFQKVGASRDERKYLGGASLIAPGIVITVAHKVE